MKTIFSKTISFVLPAYNESRNLQKTIESLLHEIDMLDYDYEIIIVNDASKDNTRNIIQNLSHNPRIKGICFSRNCGKEVALTAGLDMAIGDAVITLDADGQHPVSKIHDFIAARESGYQIVYNKRPIIKNASWLKKCSSWIFYTLFNAIADFKLEPATTDYRLMDSIVVEQFRTFKERNRIFRGIIDFLGFDRKALIFDALESDREPSYTMRKLVKLALNSVTSFSLFPLKLVGMGGIFIFLLSGIVLSIALMDRLIGGSLNFSNLAIVAISNTLLIGIVLMSLGMMALYIANIHDEVQGRPLYTIKQKIGFE